MPVEALRQVFKTLTDPTRMRILFLLERSELAVLELTRILDTAQSTVSRHLGILKDAGLLRDRREGTSIYYRFDAPTEGEWAETWQLARRSIDEDPTSARDLASLDIVLRQREVQSRRWFDEVGAEWDSIRKVFNDDVHRARAISRLIQPRLRVADIGTGTGILARDLSAAGAEVVAIDRSDRMLVAARDKLHGYERVQFRLGEANSLPVDDGEVDAAMAHMVLHYVASPEEAVREMARIVRPGGRIVIVDFVQHENEWLRQEIGVLWQGFSEAAVRRWFDDVSFFDFDIEIDQPTRRRGAELPATFIASATKPT